MEATLSTLNEYFKQNNLSNHFQNVNGELLFDGYGFRVWTDDWVIIFNEYGTGIKGQGTHPNPDGYQYNVPSDSKDSQGRWVYRNKDGEYRTTSGMEAKHIFYDIQQELNKYASDFLSTAINKSLKDEEYQSFKVSLREGA